MSVIFTNGCFDILHRGHVELLRYCHSMGRVVVGLNSDRSVKQLKGESRPYNNETDRQLILEACKFVDEVVIFDEETPYELIKKVKPDIVVKGGDYQQEDVVGNDLAEVKIFNFVDGYSTTNILEKM
jgi:rfaE bifunctional protein nucleotidyltransferase chain/domain